jgi:hypothetical protein
MSLYFLSSPFGIFVFGAALGALYFIIYFTWRSLRGVPMHEPNSTQGILNIPDYRAKVLVEKFNKGELSDPEWAVFNQLIEEKLVHVLRIYNRENGSVRETASIIRLTEEIPAKKINPPDAR